MSLLALLVCAWAGFSAVPRHALPGPGKVQVRIRLEPPRPLGRPDTVSVMILGDVMLHSAQRQHDFSGFLKYLSHETSSADFTAANLEFTLAGEPYSGYPAFSAPDSIAAVLAAENGVDIFLTANNHILDRGQAGLERTLRIYSGMRDSLGIEYTGCASDSLDNASNNPLTLFCRGIRISLVNFTYGTNLGKGPGWPQVNYMRRKEVGDAISRARAGGADFIIALPHWGTEYVLRHDSTQQEWAEWLVAQGADAVIGSHPHVVQDTDMLEVTDAGGNPRKVPVIYSLGNAISNMSAANTQIGLLLNVHVARDCWGSVSDILPEYVFLWSSLPGRLKDRHCTVKVKDYIGKEKYWRQPYEYRKMVNTYLNIKALTGIED